MSNPTREQEDALRWYVRTFRINDYTDGRGNLVIKDKLIALSCTEAQAAIALRMLEHSYGAPQIDTVTWNPATLERAESPVSAEDFERELRAELDDVTFDGGPPNAREEHDRKLLSGELYRQRSKDLEALNEEYQAASDEIEALRSEAEAIGNWIDTLNERKDEHEAELSKLSLEKQRLQEEIAELQRLKKELTLEVHPVSKRRIELE